MKKVLLIAAGLGIMFACSKEQRYVNKLDGAWTLDKVVAKEGSVTVTDDDPEGTATFQKCKLKDEDFCDYSYTTTAVFGNFTIEEENSGQYRVNGEKIETRENADDDSYEVYDIEEISRKELILVLNEDDGYVKYHYSK